MGNEDLYRWEIEAYGYENDEEILEKEFRFCRQEMEMLQEQMREHQNIFERENGVFISGQRKERWRSQ